MSTSTATTTAYLHDGRYVEVPEESVDAWRGEVRSHDTKLGLADWYTDQGDENQDEIKGHADDDTRCDHEERTHRVTNESQTGEYQKDKPFAAARVCHRRACILDGMAWVERSTGETAAWAGPHQDFRFDVPKDIAESAPAHPAPTL